MNKMGLENLTERTRFTQVFRAIRDFYENKPPYIILNSFGVSIKYLAYATGRKIKKSKSKR